jgi:hypothetical protein
MLWQLLRRNMRTPVSGKGRDCWLVRRPSLPLPADGRAHARRRTQEIIGAPHVWVGVTIDDPAQPASSSLGSLQAMMQSLNVSKRPRKGRQDSGRTSQSDWLAKINVGLITSRDTIINRKACFHCIAGATLDNVQTRTYAVSWCSVDALTSAASLRMDLSAAHPQIDTLFESLSFWLIINKPIN